VPVDDEPLAIDAVRAGSVRPRVVILGGGFAGVGAAQKLRDADAEVLLVDWHNYYTS
jgi:NADH dehydrogenase